VDTVAAAEAALASGVETPAILQLVGAARQRAGRLDEASALFQRAVALAPTDPAAWAALAGSLFAARRPEAALQVCEAGLRRLQAAPALICAKARVLRSQGQVEAAGALFRQALAADDASAEARYGLALLAVEAGDWDAAQALAAPLFGHTAAGPELDWLAARIALGRGEPEAAREHASRALAADGLAPDQWAEASLLMGEALDGLGRPAEAFRAFADGKRALRTFYAERASGRESETDKLKRLGAWFRAADPAPWRTSPPPTASTGGARAHAFLLGFPRSGTTLLEQALAGHPDLVSLEEAPTLAGAYAEFMTSPEGLQRLARLSAGEAETWRAAYWREVTGRGVDARGRVFLDKAPAGTLYLPLIAKLFPAATVLFVIRDPRDVVLSCFRNSFQMNALTYAFTDLADTAACYAACMEMAAAYRAVLPVELMEVRHEALVDDFEHRLAEIAAFLGLQLAPGMTDVAATARRRTVLTPSAAQVRAGVNRAGLGRWRAYAADLEPVMGALAPWVERFGYGV
jgi:tetratricopeptide (TPR) repeat protein